MKKEFVLLMTLLSSSSLLKAGDFKPLEADSDTIKAKINRFYTKIRSGKYSSQEQEVKMVRLTHLLSLNSGRIDQDFERIEKAAKNYLEAKSLEKKELTRVAVKSKAEDLLERKTVDNLTCQQIVMDAYRFLLEDGIPPEQAVALTIRSTGVVNWDKLADAEKDQAVTMFKLKNLVEEPKIVEAFRFYQKLGGQSPEQIVENILGGNYDSWHKLASADKEWAGQNLRSGVARSDLTELINESRIVEAFRFYHKEGKQSVSEMVENILGGHYLYWRSLLSADKEWAIKEVTSRILGQDSRESDEKPKTTQSINKLNQPLIGGEAYGDIKMLLSTTPSPHNSRSLLNTPFGADLPTIPLIHSYMPHFPVSSPFSAVFSEKEVTVPNSLKPFLDNSQREKIFFFNVQSVEPNVDPGYYYSLKPQYAIFPEAPATFESQPGVGGGNFPSMLEWTVVPGAEGKVIPKQGETGNQLLNDMVSVHPGDKNIMVLSSNSMHLQGILPTKSVDLYSLVNADNRSFITYHWVLSEPDYDKFLPILQASNNLREIMDGLKKEVVFKNLLGELQQYVGYADEIRAGSIRGKLPNGQEITFRVEHVKGDGNCAFTAMRTKRGVAGEALLLPKYMEDPEIRQWVTNDIVRAIYAYDLPVKMMQEYPQIRAFQDTHLALNNRLQLEVTNISRDIAQKAGIPTELLHDERVSSPDELLANPDFEMEYRERLETILVEIELNRSKINRLASNDATYISFINNYILGNNWLAYYPDEKGLPQYSTMDAIAKIQNKGLRIWKAYNGERQLLHAYIPFDGCEIDNLDHEGNMGGIHFNRLIPQ